MTANLIEVVIPQSELDRIVIDKWSWVAGRLVSEGIPVRATMSGLMLERGSLSRTRDKDKNHDIYRWRKEKS